MLRKAKNAFSSSETLVTLVIVIFVGSFVIFGMIHNAQQHEVVSQLKKAYTSFNSAFNIAKMNEGSPEAWSSRNSEPDKDFFKILNKYLNMHPADMPEHFSGLVYYGLNGNTELYVPKKDLTMGRFEDGTIARVANINPYCNSVRGNTTALRNICGEVYIQIRDINGNVNLTNSVLGKNTFVFYLTSEGLVPVGTKGSKEDAQFLCRKSKDMKINSKSCSAWALQKENLDYLRHSVEW